MRHQHFLAALVIVTAPVTAGNVNESKGDFQPATYCVYDIGRLPGLPPGETSLAVRAINKRNQIVGWTAIAGGSSQLHPFIWDRESGMRDLGSLPGHANGVAADVNDAGTVVGDATDFETGGSRAFIWTEPTGMRALDVSLGGVDSVATGINRSGQIVGASKTATGAFHAFRRDVNGDVLDLGAFPDGSWDSSATAVNDRGHVVGARWDGQITEAFLWDERNGMRLLAEHPGAPSVFPFPIAINNRGEVVGETRGADPSRAFRWTKSAGLQDLGTLSGLDTHTAIATSINRSGVIVGASQTTLGPPHAFVWNKQTGMRDLNELIDPSSELASEAVLVIAQAINDVGSIAADCFVPDPVDPQRSFLLVPRRQSDKVCQ